MSKRPISLLLMFMLLTATLRAQVALEAQSVTGKVIAGYQGWFTCYGDGSPVARWSHWSGGVYQSNNGYPAPGHLSFEAYPDVSEYAQLFQTGFGNLSDGGPSKLFSSYPLATLDLHFKWMQQNGIDGVGLQRFLGETKDGVFKAHRDSVAVRMRRAAEKYQRIFYIMYDLSADDTTYFKTDWSHIENDLNVLSSPYYAHQNGKPVICLWGFGFTGRPNAPVQSLAIINWLKRKGYYVIGGVPTNWRNGTDDSFSGYSDVYKAFNMISPWSVGRFIDTAGADTFRVRHLVPDLTYCNANGIDYQPVLFPGFAWSNWNGGTKNQIPRNKGEFFWHQLYNVKNLGISTAYIAMFDEYDEGTAIAKMADSYLTIPGNQYFLTTSADGTYISPDFYLRLAGQATKVLKGTAPLTANVTIPYVAAPNWLKTSLESGYDAALTWTDSAEPTSVPKNILGYNGTATPICGTVSGETSHSGNYSIRVAGQDNAAATASFYYFRSFDVNIPVTTNTRLSFWTYPTNTLSRYVSVDLIFTDGTALRNTAATDLNGVSMHPGAGRGTVNTWQQTSSYIGNWVSGKTIDRIVIAYDHTQETGNFKTYIDDIIINDTTLVSAPTIASVIDVGTDEEKGVTIFPQPADNMATIKFSNDWKGLTDITILNAGGYRVNRQTVSVDGNQILLQVDQLPAGVYFVRISNRTKKTTKRLVIAGR
ncbi:Por secretion system C-terminal sorting domain-containing protein [Chitinophaga sp. CF118]|uniref:T9SS type A sorting domain-containing protein n=1 Tax=Chitinophaga sp. CF118 TaxID=1884367 RepID=UPI0008EDBFB4|nr:T9SS type A sorting domain-containing protein [Chitinophaga sp. CF118]SFE11800.1 Por secretion system C-terminal sorting domain-containing protein [Chitinophaga sp. CF118]